MDLVFVNMVGGKHRLCETCWVTLCEAAKDGIEADAAFDVVILG